MVRFISIMWIFLRQALTAWYLALSNPHLGLSGYIVQRTAPFVPHLISLLICETSHITPCLKLLALSLVSLVEVAAVSIPFAVKLGRPWSLAKVCALPLRGSFLEVTLTRPHRSWRVDSMSI